MITLSKDKERIPLDPVTENQIREVVYNETVLRSRILERLLDERRDIDIECGFPKTADLTIDIYKMLYEREGIAARVVEVMPEESWKVSPEVKDFSREDTEDPNTPFEDSWDNLNQMLSQESNDEGLRMSWFKPQEDDGHALWRILKRADIRSGIGHYGGVFIGFDDIVMEQEIDSNGRPVFNEQGEPVYNLGDTAGLSFPVEPSKDRKVLFMKVLDEKMLTISSYNEDITSPRYGKPEFYDVTLNDINSQLQGSVRLSISQVKVHWSRIIHVAENIESQDDVAVPRMRTVYNHLYNLRKIYHGGGEMFWMGAFMGLSFETHPQLGSNVTLDLTKMREQMELYMNRLQRFIAQPGMTVKPLAPQVVDPNPHVDAQITAICIKLGIPKRIFMGSERGELASSQDSSNHEMRVKGRRLEYLTPSVIVKTIDRLIMTGVLVEPQEGYTVTWPEADTVDEEKKGLAAFHRSNALARYVQGGVEDLIDPIPYITEIIGLTQKQAETLVRDDIDEDFEPIPDEEPEEGSSMESKEDSMDEEEILPSPTQNTVSSSVYRKKEDWLELDKEVKDLFIGDRSVK